MWTAILGVLNGLFSWLAARTNTEAAVNEERLREAEDANAQVTTANEARADVRDDLATHPERVRDVDGDARPFDENNSG